MNFRVAGSATSRLLETLHEFDDKEQWLRLKWRMCICVNVAETFTVPAHSYTRWNIRAEQKWQHVGQVVFDFIYAVYAADGSFTAKFEIGSIRLEKKCFFLSSFLFIALGPNIVNYPVYISVHSCVDTWPIGQSTLWWSKRNYSDQIPLWWISLGIVFHQRSSTVAWKSK